MNSESVWATFWFSVVVVICLTIVSCSYLSNKDDARRAQDMQTLISRGASPVEARCAVEGFNTGSAAQQLICQQANAISIIQKQTASAPTL